MQVISIYSISHEIHCTSYILYDIIYPILSICIPLKPFICILIYPNIAHNIPFCLPYIPISPYKFPNIHNIMIISLKSKIFPIPIHLYPNLSLKDSHRSIETSACIVFLDTHHGSKGITGWPSLVCRFCTEILKSKSHISFGFVTLKSKVTTKN